MLKLRKLTDLFLVFFQIMFLIAIGIFVKSFMLEIWANLIVNILVVAEILFVLGITYKLEYTSKSATFISFILIGIFYLFFIVLSFRFQKQIPNFLCAIYEDIMGYLAFNGFLLIYKRNRHKAYSKIFLIIGSIIFILTFVVSMMSVFGLATSQVY